jgi:hypothetical protein
MHVSRLPEQRQTGMLSPRRRVATPVLWAQHAAVRSPWGHTGRLPFIGHASGGRLRLWTTAERLWSAAENPLTLAGCGGNGAQRECYVHNLWTDLWNT